jgi:hypothetical protein
MSGYFENYGVADARRSKIIRNLVISGVALVILALVLYFTLRTLPAKRTVNTFLEDLRRQDYKAAYVVWGCATPCRDYSFDRFMRDWGPKGAALSSPSAGIRGAQYCSSGGVIVSVGTSKTDTVDLMYDRANHTLSFAPWPVCNPRIPAPENAP